MKRLRTRLAGDVGDEVESVLGMVLRHCSKGEGDLEGLTKQVDELKHEVEAIDSAVERAKEMQEKIEGCSSILRMCKAYDGGSANKTGSNRSTDAATQTANDASGNKRPRVETGENTVPPSLVQITTPPMMPSPAPTTPTTTSLLVFEQPSSSSLTLSEGELVRIAADLMFSIVRVAQRQKHICSLSELFIECDRDCDGGISFTELLAWFKETLGLTMSDWQLDEFGRRLNWKKACQHHPKRFIDEKGFLTIMKGVWKKVKWYFNNAVVYGVSERPAATRSDGITERKDDIRDVIYRLIHVLVVKNCHIHTFFALFDAQRTQKVSVGDFGAALWAMKEELKIETQEKAYDVAKQFCQIAKDLYSGEETGSSSPTPAESVSLLRLQDLVRDFFSDLENRIEFDVLSAEVRTKFIFRNIFFGLCGIFENTSELQPIANLFYLFSKYSASNGLLTAENIQNMLRQEFSVLLTPIEIMQLISISDRDKDRLLNMNEMVQLLDHAHIEINARMKARMPTDFRPTETDLGFSGDIIHTFSKLVLRILHSEETFADFFKTLPKFRPKDFLGTGDASRYPDEVVYGLKRLGITASADIFEGWGGRKCEGWTGFSWGPSRSVLDIGHFLQGVWFVYVKYIEPAFQNSINWEAEAAGVSAYAATSLMRHFKIVPASTTTLLETLWGHLVTTAEQETISSESLIRFVAIAVRKNGERLRARATLTSKAVLKNTGPDYYFDKEFTQLLHLLGVKGQVSRAQLKTIFR
eukprot:TRINITY_DN21009_c0_g1_i1.p1 TRINITY_DN21009_c0_g1~~TRINITY_DN21009_c0_g1_i1.p1  ORF type:complete len:755 (+),score=110.20 TRINITY_DN21009_c0_g1_i1:67-2331(+)